MLTATFILALSLIAQGAWRSLEEDSRFNDGLAAIGLLGGLGLWALAVYLWVRG